MVKHTPTYATSPSEEDCLRFAKEAEEAAAQEPLRNVQAKHLRNAKRWRELAQH
jgi:hypothetical protein